MEKMVLDDFIRYAKEQFDCEISVKKCDKPDTFASIFGASFLNDKYLGNEFTSIFDTALYKEKNKDIKISININ